MPDLCTAQAVFFLILTAELLVFALVLFSSSPLLFDWSQLALTSFFVQWVVLLSASILCGSRRLLSRLPLIAGATLSYGMILVVTAVVTLMGQWVVAGGMAVLPFNLGEMLRNLMMSAIVGGATLRYFYLQQQLRMQQQAELKARIQALQSRIKPHFLFNSMNIIASLITTDPDSAEMVVEDLSELFRASLGEAGVEVSLERELSLCLSYIRIEQLRLGDRLRVNWDIQAGLEEVDIPSLTIQPLLENAIYHGIQPLPDGGEIQVKITASDDELFVEIKNPFEVQLVGTSKFNKKGNHMALSNIRSRLEALYGPTASVSTRVDNDTFVTYLHYAI